MKKLKKILPLLYIVLVAFVFVSFFVMKNYNQSFPEAGVPLGHSIDNFLVSNENCNDTAYVGGISVRKVKYRTYSRCPNGYRVTGCSSTTRYIKSPTSPDYDLLDYFGYSAPSGDLPWGNGCAAETEFLAYPRPHVVNNKICLRSSAICAKIN